MRTTMKSFKKFNRPDMLNRLIRTPVEEATKIAEKIFSEHDRDLETELPHFNMRYSHARKIMMDVLGKREGIPRIRPKQIKIIQKSLANGYINFEKNSFPKGVVDRLKNHWLTIGIDMEDREQIPVKKEIVRLNTLKPTQYNIYINSAFQHIAKVGSTVAAEYIENTSLFIVTKDNFIVDGHDRWFGSFLMNKNMKGTVLKIDMDLDELLPLTLKGSSL